MFVGVGTIINVLAILIGAALGRSVGNRLPDKTRSLIMDVLGAVTLISAASAIAALWDQELKTALPEGSGLLIVLAALILGGLTGSAIKIEERLDSLGERLQRFFLNTSKTSEGSQPSTFVAGFVTASLIFVVGPLAILGSISDGMSAGIDQLLLKSILDFFASIAFAAALGWGVAFSALPVAIYQGLWTGIGFLLGEVMSEYQISAMTATGGVLLFGIGLKLLNIKSVSIGNLLPSLAFAPVLALAVSTLN